MSTAADFPPSLTEPTVEPTVAAAVPLRQRTLSGFIWVAFAIASNKLIGFACGLVLARLLTPDDFGIIAVAQTVATFVFIFRESGVPQVLVQRGNRFDEWAGPAFGLITCLSWSSGILMATVARPAAAWYGTPDLEPMLYVFAATSPLAGMANVAFARMEHDLRFRALGMIATITIISQYIIWILLAWLGFGSISFAWSLFGSNLIRLSILWTLSFPQTKNFFHIRSWFGLLSDCMWLIGAGILWAIVSQFDRVALGRISDTETVGLYFFAYNQTTQISQLLSSTLSQVLYPTLSKLADNPPRQRQVFLESSRLLAFIATPLSILQAVLASPYVAMFGPKWTPAVPIVQILCIGAAFVVCSTPAQAFIQSQGRFRTYFFVNVVFTTFNILFVASAAVFFKSNASIAIAIAVSLYFFIFGPAAIQLATKNWKLPWPEAWHVFTPGATIAAAGALAAFPALAWMHDGPRQWIVAGGVYVVTGLLTAVLLFRKEFNQTVAMGMSFLKGRRQTSE